MVECSISQSSQINMAKCQTYIVDHYAVVRSIFPGLPRHLEHPDGLENNQLQQITMLI